MASSEQQSARCWRALTFAFRATADGSRLLDPLAGLSDLGSSPSRHARAQGDETSIDDFEVPMLRGCALSRRRAARARHQDVGSQRLRAQTAAPVQAAPENVWVSGPNRKS